MKSSFGLRAAYVISLLVGVFLVVSGVLLLFFRPIADALFDLHGDHSLTANSLATEVGVRQLVIGLIIAVLSMLKERKALGMVMVIGWLVPLADFIDYAPVIGVVSALRHGATVPVVLIAGVILLMRKSREEESPQRTQKKT